MVTNGRDAPTHCFIYIDKRQWQPHKHNINDWHFISLFKSDATLATSDKKAWSYAYLGLSGKTWNIRLNLFNGLCCCCVHSSLLCRQFPNFLYSSSYSSCLNFFICGKIGVVGTKLGWNLWILTKEQGWHGTNVHSYTGCLSQERSIFDLHQFQITICCLLLLLVLCLYVCLGSWWWCANLVFISL